MKLSTKPIPLQTDEEGRGRFRNWFLFLGEVWQAIMGNISDENVHVNARIKADKIRHVGYGNLSETDMQDAVDDLYVSHEDLINGLAQDTQKEIIALQNGKQASGDYLTGITGDVVATAPSGGGSAPSTIQNGVVTDDKVASGIAGTKINHAVYGNLSETTLPSAIDDLYVAHEDLINGLAQDVQKEIIALDNRFNNMSGDVTIVAGVTAIASGVIVNDDVNASAAIAVSKLAGGVDGSASGYFKLGNMMIEWGSFTLTAVTSYAGHYYDDKAKQNFPVAFKLGSKPTIVCSMADSAGANGYAEALVLENDGSTFRRWCIASDSNVKTIHWIALGLIS